MDMDEVHAANKINVKNVALSMLPNGRFAKAIGRFQTAGLAQLTVWRL